MNDPIVSCPYNNQHRVPRSRLQIHIIKCKKNYPTLSICPFNATHRMPNDELRAHVQSCPSRLDVIPDKLPVVRKHDVITPKPLMQRDFMDEDDPNNECWD